MGGAHAQQETQEYNMAIIIDNTTSGIAIISGPDTGTVNIGDPSTSTTTTLTLNQPGEVQLITGSARWYSLGLRVFTSLDAALGTASNSGNVTFVIKKNLSIVATGTILSGSNRLLPQAINVAVDTEDFLTIDVTAAGTSASDLTIRLR